jgi:hypothetical protein
MKRVAMPSQLEDPILLSEVDDVLTDRAIGGALKRAGARIEATALEHFATSIRASAAQYVRASQRPTLNTVHRESAAFARLLYVRDKTEGNYQRLATMSDELSDDARRIFADGLQRLRESEKGKLVAWDDFAALRGGPLLRPRPTPVFVHLALPTAATSEIPTAGPALAACSSSYSLPAEVVIGTGLRNRRAARLRYASGKQRPRSRTNSA